MNTMHFVRHQDDNNNPMLIIQYQQDWDEEDINALSKNLLNTLNVIKPLEVIVGADRQDVRFDYQDAILQLHFEVNSNSCWLEPEVINRAGAQAIKHAYLALSA